MSGFGDNIKRLKYLPWLIPVLLVVAAVIWLVFGGYDVVRDFFESEPGGVNISNPPPPADVGIPEDAEPVSVIKDSLTTAEKLNPFHIETRAEELTKDLPAGTEVYEVQGSGLIYRTPDGFIYETGDLDVTAYRTPESFIAAEFRPKVMGTTDLLTVGIGAEFCLLRLWNIHLGPAAGINLNRTGWVGAGVGYNIWKNLYVGGYGGKALGDDGWTGGVSVGVGVE